MDNRKQGILFIIMAGFFFALMTFFVRISGELPTMEKAFFRNAVAAVIAFVTMIRSGVNFRPTKENVPDLFMRSLCGTIGLICNFYAIDRNAWRSGSRGSVYICQKAWKKRCTQSCYCFVFFCIFMPCVYTVYDYKFCANDSKTASFFITGRNFSGMWAVQHYESLHKSTCT